MPLLPLSDRSVQFATMVGHTNRSQGFFHVQLKGSLAACNDLIKTKSMNSPNQLWLALSLSLSVTLTLKAWLFIGGVFRPSSPRAPPQPISWSYQQCVCLPSGRQPNLIGPHQLQTLSEMEEGVCVCVCVQCLHSTCQLVLRFFSLRGRYIKVGKHRTATAALGKHSIVFNAWDVSIRKEITNVDSFIFIW